VLLGAGPRVAVPSEVSTGAVRRPDELTPLGVAEPRQKDSSDRVDVVRTAHTPVIEVGAPGSADAAATIEGPLKPEEDGRSRMVPSLADRELPPSAIALITDEN